jgi:hypothetical protein
MNFTGKDEMLIRRYLLGEVTDQEREQVERQLMTDRRYLNRILRVEESLMDEYVRGELDHDEIGPFETYFLSAPERRDKLGFAESLNRYIAEERDWKAAGVAGADSEAAGPKGAWLWPSRPAGRTAMALLAVATLVLAACIIMLLTHNARLKGQILEQQANLSHAEEELRRHLDEQTRRSEELARQLEQSQNEAARIGEELSRLKQEKAPHQEPPPPIVASLIVAPGSVRDNGRINRVNLTTDTQRLKLELKLQGEDYRSYRVEVQTIEGKSLWKEVNLRARQRAGEKSVVAILPASRLPEGDYLATVSGAAAGGGYEEVATYYFTVIRE